MIEFHLCPVSTFGERRQRTYADPGERDFAAIPRLREMWRISEDTRAQREREIERELAKHREGIERFAAL